MKQIAILLLTVLLGTTVVSAQQTFEPKFRFSPGKLLRYQYATSYDMVQEVQGQEMVINGSVNSLLKVEVESLAPNGDASVLGSYEEMTVRMNMMGNDTVMPQDAILGKRTRSVISVLGNEVSRTDIDTVKAGQMATGMAIALSGHLVTFPGRPLGFGDKWSTDLTDTTEIGKGYTATRTKTEYTLAGREEKNGRSCLRISFTGESEISGKIIQMGMELFLEGTGSNAGNAWFDDAEGVLVARESTSAQDMTYALTGTMSISIPATQTIRNTFVLKE